MEPMKARLPVGEDVTDSLRALSLEPKGHHHQAGGVDADNMMLRNDARDDEENPPLVAAAGLADMASAVLRYVQYRRAVKRASVILMLIVCLSHCRAICPRA